MFRWDSEGRYCCTKSMAIAPFWCLTEHQWIMLINALLALNWLYIKPCYYIYMHVQYAIHVHTCEEFECKKQYIPGGQKKTEQSIQSIFQDFVLINSYLFSPCWIEHLFLIIITPRSSNLVENFFILWEISYGLSFLGFARFPEFQGTINECDKLMANPEHDSP